MSNLEPKKNIARRAFIKGGALAGLAPTVRAAQAGRRWDREADVVVVGSGASGLPASIIAKENGARVILVEANDDIGGHAAVCTGNIPLGGGTAAQKAAGIEDSPDIIFRDLCDCSVVGSNGAAEYRYNDRDIVRAFADNNVFAYDFLVAHGLTWTESGTRLAGCDPGGQVGSQGNARGHLGIPADSDRRSRVPRGWEEQLPGASASCAHCRQPRGKRAWKSFSTIG